MLCKSNCGREVPRSGRGYCCNACPRGHTFWCNKRETEVEINATEPIFGIEIGMVTLKVHDPAKCEGRPCVIHHPSDHPMKDWPLNWRSDIRVMERTCPHGVGHPDPDHMAYVRSLTPEHDCPNDREFGMNKFRQEADWPECEYPHLEWQGIHGCDGCCHG